MRLQNHFPERGKAAYFFRPDCSRVIRPLCGCLQMLMLTDAVRLCCLPMQLTGAAHQCCLSMLPTDAAYQCSPTPIRCVDFLAVLNFFFSLIFIFIFILLLICPRQQSAEKIRSFPLYTKNNFLPPFIFSASSLRLPNCALRFLNLIKSLFCFSCAFLGTESNSRVHWQDERHPLEGILAKAIELYKVCITNQIHTSQLYSNQRHTGELNGLRGEHGRVDVFARASCEQDVLEMSSSGAHST